MKRRLLNLATALSLLVFVGAVVMWWYWAGSREWWPFGNERAYMLVFPCIDGQLFIEVHRPFPNSPKNEVEFSRLELPGFWYRHAGGGDWKDNQFWAVGISYWLIMSLAGILPVAWVLRGTPAMLARRRERRRTRLGLCARCGYDLRTTPGRCPECGTSPVGTAT